MTSFITLVNCLDIEVSRTSNINNMKITLEDKKNKVTYHLKIVPRNHLYSPSELIITAGKNEKH